MQAKENIQIVEKNPELLKDISIMKLVLLPTELLVLKYFFVVGRPLTIREVYRIAIDISFNLVFNNGNVVDKNYKLLSNQLIGEGYGVVYVDSKESEKILKAYTTETSGFSDSQSAEIQYKYLMDHKVKVLSYAKLLNVFNRLVDSGIIFKRGQEGKGIFYAMNPNFWKLFKDKKEQILNL